MLDIASHSGTFGRMSRRRSGRGKLDTHLMVRLSTELREGLEAAAEEDRRGLSDYVRIVLEDHLAARKKRR